MDLDPVLLARIQFAFTVSFHIIFPSFTIGLAAYIATLEVMWVSTGREVYGRLSNFWTKIFAVSFGMGVVSGIVLSYEFGTNWSRFSVAFGNVIGPLMGYEVLSAFFLEATFLGIMLFGVNRVPKWLHVTSAIVVAVGTSLSAFWILSANSWMHTPAGHEMRAGVAYPVDWWAIVFNPSFPYRFAHMLNASYLTTGFVVLAVGARYLVAGKFNEDARTMLKMAIGLLVVLAPLQLLIGDQHGLNTLKYQPTKIAAMEAHWDSNARGDFVVFAWPDQQAETNRFAIKIPYGSSLILTHSFDGKIPALKDVPRDQRPPVPNVFFAFRIMVGIGLLMILAALFGAFLWWRGRLFEARWYLLIVQHGWWMGFVAIIAGWVVTESGRQPWIVQGIMRTAEAASAVSGQAVATTLVLFVVVYTFIFSLGIYYINRLIAKGPQGVAVAGSPELANRPMAAARGAGKQALGEV